MTDPATGVRRMVAGDSDAGLPVWDAYNGFHRNELAEDVDCQTLRRMHEGGFHGLVAQEDDGLVAFLHAVFHPSRWTVGEYCYLEDLLVARPTRYGDSETPRRGRLRGGRPAGRRTRLLAHRRLQRTGRPLYDSIGRLRSYAVYEG